MPTTSGGFLDIERIVASMGLQPGMKVADLGCGSGYFPVAIARVVGKDGIVSAVDVRLEPLQAVRTQAEAAGLGNVHDIRADLEVRGGTGIPDNTQDIALLANVLFQSQKKEAIVAEAARMLKPGGRLIVIDWKKGATGIGPSDEVRMTPEAMQTLVVGQGVSFQGTLDAGQFYYGLIFLKP